MKYGDYLGTAISQHMTSKYLTKSLTHLLQARIVEVIMYDCPVLVSSARSSISKPLIEIHIFESKKLKQSSNFNSFVKTTFHFAIVVYTTDLRFSQFLDICF